MGLACQVAAPVPLVHLAARFDLRRRLVAPDVPPLARMTREQFQVRPRTARLDQGVLLVRLAGVLPLAGLDHVDLPPGRAQRPGVLAAHPEQDELGDVAEVEADPAAVRAAVQPALGPDEVADVAESPGL